MRFLLRRSPTPEADAEKNFGAIDLRPRRHVHADALARILDQLHADRHAEKIKQAGLRDDLAASEDAEAEIAELIESYGLAHGRLAG